jgi:putative transposase
VALKEGNAMPDDIHMVLSVPPKYGIVMTIGYLKDESAVRVLWQVLKTKGTLFGGTFWATRYCVSTVVLDEEEIPHYVRGQERLPKDEEQPEFDYRFQYPAACGGELHFE